MTDVQLEGVGSLSKCPICGSNNINAHDWDGDGNSAWCEVDCDDCDTTWMEEFYNPVWAITYNGKTGEEYDNKLDEEDYD